MSPSSDSDIQPTASAGQILRHARLKAGVHLAVLSVHLKVPVRQLEALEADVWDAAKGPVFYRALAASVCRHLNADAGPVLALLPRPSGQFEPSRTPHFSDPPDRVDMGRRLPFRRVSVSRYWVLSAVVLVLFAAWAWLSTVPEWLGRDLLKFSFFSQSSAQLVTQEVKTSSIPAALSPEAARLESRDALPSSMTVPPVQATQESSSVNTGELSSGKNLSSSPPVMGLATAQWIFSATAESWLELRNAQGVVVWSGILKAGETQRIDSPLPVRVVVGRAQVVTASLRGQPFDLKPYTQVTVARFEVKE